MIGDYEKIEFVDGLTPLNKENLDKMDSKLLELDENAESANTDMSDMQDAVKKAQETADGAVSTNTEQDTSISSNASDITALQTENESLKAQIAELEDEISELNTDLANLNLSYYFTSMDALLDVVNANMATYKSIPMVANSTVASVLTNDATTSFIKGLLFPMVTRENYFDFMLTTPNYIYIGRYDNGLTTCNRLSGTSIL